MVEKTVNVPESLLEGLCRCLAFCAWQSHILGTMVVTKPERIPGDEPYEQAVYAASGTDAANTYERAYQVARELITICGMNFDDLLPEKDRGEFVLVRPEEPSD